MIIKRLNRIESQNAMQEWLINFPELPRISDEYISIRLDLQEKYNKIISESSNQCRKSDYFIDVNFGIYLYDYLNNKSWFNMRLASDDDFWRYLSLKVVPDIVSDRWGKDNETHFWSRPVRIWLKSIWWYIHLSWQGNVELTEKLLISPCFSTDTILNLQERTGRKGTYINVYRYIMYFYSQVPNDHLKIINKNTSKKDDNLFRSIMKLHTAKVIVIEPALYPGGEQGYAKSLFEDMGIEIK